MGRYRAFSGRLILSCACALLLAGCAAVMQSTKVVSDSDIPSREGIAYFLPMGKVHITAVLTNWFETNPVPDQTLVIPWGAGTNKDAPNPSVKISITQKQIYRLTIDQVTVPDASQLYSLRLKSKAYAEDNFGITISSNGFLTTINATNTEQTGEIVKTLADTGIEVAKLIGGEGLARMAQQAHNLMSTNQALTAATLPERIDFTFNPLDAEELEDANTQFQGVLKVSIASEDHQGVTIGYGNKNTTANADGFYYRPALPYDLLVKSAFETIQTTLCLPNNAPILTYNIKRAPFVSVTNQLGLQNGFLVQVASSKPSELLEAAKIPYYIATSVATIPTNILQLKVDYSSANQNLLNQQSNTLAAYENLIKAQTQFAAFMKTNQSATSSASH